MAGSYQGGPVAALRRIAFLMERGREETRRIQAFRNAAAVILPLPADEVAARAAAGTLTELAGIGPSTAMVITDAVNGVMPERLEKLEAAFGPLVKGGDEVRAQLKGDLHSHSDWSDGGSPIEEMAFTAIELGHDYLVLTDHSPRLTVASGLSVERLTRQLGVVEAINDHLAGTQRTSPCSRGSRSTSSTTVGSTRPRRCWPSSTSAWPACTASCGWTPPR